MIKIATTRDAWLRERAVDLEEAQRALQWQRDEVARVRGRDLGQELHRADLGRALGRLGHLARVAGELDEALGAREEARAIWAELGRDKARWLAELECAAVLGDKGRGEEALAELDRLADEEGDGGLEVYRVVLLEARAVVRWGLGQREEALADLEEAHLLCRGRKARERLEELEHEMRETSR